MLALMCGHMFPPIGGRFGNRLFRHVLTGIARAGSSRLSGGWCHPDRSDETAQL